MGKPVWGEKWGPWVVGIALFIYMVFADWSIEFMREVFGWMILVIVLSEFIEWRASKSPEEEE